MAGLLSPQAQTQLAVLDAMLIKVQSVYAQVERYAGTRNPVQAEALTMPLKRAFGRLKIEFMGAGLDALSQLAGAMEIAAGRGGSLATKSRILREGVGSMRFQVEQAQRQVVLEDRSRQQARAAREAERSQRDE
jgi:hypothetical protein